MPRFRKPPAELVIRTGQPPDHIVWRFSRTAPVERAFTAAHGIDDPAARGRALLAAMVEALQDWEGVLDEEGAPLPYSPEAFFEYVPATLRAEVLRQWIASMLGASETAQQADPHDSDADEVTEDPDHDEPAHVGVLSRSVPPSEVPTDGRAGQPAFVAEPASPPAIEAPLAEEPASPPEELRDPVLPHQTEAGGQGSSPGTDDPAPDPPPRPDPRLPGPADLLHPNPRAAQAPGLRVFSPPPIEQAHPTNAIQTNPSPQPAQLRLLEAGPEATPPPDSPALPLACADQPCPLLDPDFDWEPLIRPAWEALHKQTRREETAEAAF